MWDLKSPLPQAGGYGGGGGDLPIAVVGGQAWSGRVEGSRAEAGESIAQATCCFLSIRIPNFQCWKDGLDVLCPVPHVKYS